MKSANYKQKRAAFVYFLLSSIVLLSFLMTQAVNAEGTIAETQEICKQSIQLFRGGNFAEAEKLLRDAIEKENALSQPNQENLLSFYRNLVVVLKNGPNSSKAGEAETQVSELEKKLNRSEQKQEAPVKNSKPSEKIISTSKLSPAERLEYYSYCDSLQALVISISAGGTTIENSCNGPSMLTSCVEELADVLSMAIKNNPAINSGMNGVQYKLSFLPPANGLWNKSSAHSPLFQIQTVGQAFGQDTRRLAVAGLLDKEGIKYMPASMQFRAGGAGITDSFNSINHFQDQPLSCIESFHGGLTCQNSFDQSQLNQLPFDRTAPNADQIGFIHALHARPVAVSILLGGLTITNSFNGAPSFYVLTNRFLSRLTSKIPASKLAAVSSIEISTGGLRLKNNFND